MLAVSALAHGTTRLPPRFRSLSRLRCLKSSKLRSQERVSRQKLASDLWRWSRQGGLGLSCKRVYEAVIESGGITTPKSVAKRLQISLAAVWHHLRTLKRAELVIQERGVVRRSARTVDQVLQGRGVQGATRRQQA